MFLNLIVFFLAAILSINELNLLIYIFFIDIYNSPLELSWIRISETDISVGSSLKGFQAAPFRVSVFGYKSHTLERENRKQMTFVLLFPFFYWARRGAV